MVSGPVRDSWFWRPLPAFLEGGFAGGWCCQGHHGTAGGVYHLLSTPVYNASRTMPLAASS
jgi:hypothetical protein